MPANVTELTAIYRDETSDHALIFVDMLVLAD